METYDSTKDTLAHILLVRKELEDFSRLLYKRALAHDASKLEPPEKGLFDELTPILSSLVYGSDEYNASLQKLKPALDHHYASNSHHPEYYGEKGIDGMNLLDLVEMWCDWKAASKRTAQGDIHKSLEINKKRFNISEQLFNILKNST